MAPRRKRSDAGRGKHRSDGDNDGLPMSQDVLFEVLLPFPAKELCRLRLVCRSWRALLSREDFIAAHMTRHHKYPFIVIGYNKRLYKDTGRPDDVLCDIMDISGRVVKRIRSTGAEIRNDAMVSAHADLVCVSDASKQSFRLLNPVTGAVYTIPDRLAEEHAVLKRDILLFLPVFVMFGRVSSTAEYKVLRVLDRISDNDKHSQVCEIFTLGSGHDRWRGKKPPPNRLAFQKNVVVIDNIVYSCLDNHIWEQDAKPDYVASFDLETEEWRPTLRGPVSKLLGSGARYNMGLDSVSLASLNGCLVMVYRTPPTLGNPSINLWFLTDFEKCLWVNKYVVQMDVPEVDSWRTLKSPLFAMDDGRMLLLYKEDKRSFSSVKNDSGVIKIYDSRTGTSTDVAKIKHCGAVGLYTGSLLSVAT